LEAHKTVSGEDRPFFAGIYARLSVDSHSQKNESIETQIAIGEEFIRKHNEDIQENTQENLHENIQEHQQKNTQESLQENLQCIILHNKKAELNKDVICNQETRGIGYIRRIELYGCYQDLGRSGTTFHREGFHRLMADIRSGKINCVIVKDFSRLGRDYIETGNYIEKIFPMLGVRFISVTDGYDSLHPICEPEHIGMQLKNLVNELYARDISYRVKTAKQAKKEKGSYTGGNPPYGYTILREDGRRMLAPDPETAPILRLIFDKYKREKNAGSIIKYLYAEKIHRPKDARKYAHAYCQPSEILREWDYAGIKFLLQNELYREGEAAAPVTETLVEGKVFDEIQEHFRENARRFSPIRAICDHNKELSYESRNYDGLQISYHQLAEGCEICGERTKDGLIRLSGQLQERSEVCGDRTKDGIIHLSCQVQEGRNIGSDKILLCGECGAPMERISSRGGGTYHCRNGRRIDQFACEHKYISLQEIEQILDTLRKLEWWLEGITASDWDTCLHQSLAVQKSKYLRDIDKIHKKASSMTQELTTQYSRYRTGEINREEFSAYRSSRERYKAATKGDREVLEQKIQKCINMESDYIVSKRVYFTTCIKFFPVERIEIHYNYRRDALPYTIA
jgi:DNA invertase Pin-like site-specific DNA recombinase